MIIIGIEGIKCRALIDTGPGASYISSNIDRINKKPIRKQYKRIDSDHEFKFQTETNNLEKNVLLEF